MPDDSRTVCRALCRFLCTQRCGVQAKAFPAPSSLLHRGNDQSLARTLDRETERETEREREREREACAHRTHGRTIRLRPFVGKACCYPF